MNDANRAGIAGLCLGVSGGTGIVALFRLTGAPPAATSAAALVLCLVSALVATALWITGRRP